MKRQYPSKRQIALEYLNENQRFKPTDEITNLPWIDIHNHAHTLSWADRELYPLTGCVGSVMMAYTYYYTPYRPVNASDVQFHWDQALVRSAQIERAFLHDTRIGIGIHGGTPVSNTDALLDDMAKYCELDEIVAIGEVGFNSTHDYKKWSIKEYHEVLRKQMEIASVYDLPVIMHTPPSSGYKGGEEIQGVHYHEINLGLSQDLIFNPEQPDIDAVDHDIAAAHDAGLPEQNLVFSHADSTLADYLLNNTDAYVSFTISRPWLDGINASHVAEAIREFGPDRILLETDTASIIRGDVTEMKRSILDLYRLGMEIHDIKKVVYENPSTLLNFTTD